MNVKIDGIDLRGSKRTARSLVVHEFASKGCAHMTEHENINVCPTQYESFWSSDLSFLQRVVSRLAEATHGLKNLSIFDAVDTNLELLPHVLGERFRRARVIVSVKEKGIPFLSVSGDVRTGGGMTGEVGGDVKAGLRSPFGKGELIT